MAPLDRKNALLGQAAITGIDFVAVHASQTTLDVFLFHDPSALTPALVVGPAQVVITGEDEPTIPVTAVVAVPGVDGREVLRVTVARPGGFGRYWLELRSPQLDLYYRRIEIDWKATCPRDVDCAPPPHACPPPAPDDVTIDPAARDFQSLRQALLELAHLRHPGWKDRLEADVGVMMVEVLAAMGDELAFYQDRVARETQFGSASQRRSVRRHVRLVDYALHDGLGAHGWIAVTAADTLDEAPAGWREVPPGMGVWACGDGVAIGFEVGTLAGALGLTATAPRNADVPAPPYRVHDKRNKLPAHVWDGDAPDPHAAHRSIPGACLPVGATAVFVAGDRAALFAAEERVFLVTEPPATERQAAPRRLLVTLRAVDVLDDPLGAALGTGGAVTRLTWHEPTPCELDLAWLFVLGNAVPVTAGVTRGTTFSLGGNLTGYPQAIERVGADGSVAFLHTLPARGPGPASVVPTDAIWPHVEDQELVRLGRDPRAAVPELAVHEVSGPGATTLGAAWEFRPTLIGASSSTPHDRHVTLDDGTWDRAVGFQRAGGEVVHHDYLTGTGVTVRFGDGEFGQIPAKGNPAVGQERYIHATYRLGNGTRGNLPGGALRFADPASGTAWTAPDPSGGPGAPRLAVDFVVAVDNPLPTTAGVDAETIAQAKRDAPDEFRAITYRAVRPEDFDEAAARLAWVQQAGTQFRWTGSWSTAFTTADPRRDSELPADRRRALAQHLDRFRMTGRELHVRAPRYADLDLVVTVCIEPSAYAAQVVVAIVRALLGVRGVRPIAGFFDPDRFTFGTALDRSELEAWIQQVPGVRAVKRVALGRRGWFASRPFVEPYYQPGADEVIRVLGDPRHPDRGTVRIEPEGGA
ncbi:MAG: hypothetical protein K8W52_42575 [Deltaproteobacteria bacterium]|nr:hypothetical protein [Deltaproteobacteria bacterium]